MIGVCEHPLSDLVIAGESVNPLPTVFHTLLQTIADLMLLPPPGMFFALSTILFLQNRQKWQTLIFIRFSFATSCHSMLGH